jgi:hypothetical protein
MAYTPLGLHVEIVSADGSKAWRLQDDDLNAANRPQGIRFDTARFEGFKTCEFSLSRRADRDYPDLKGFHTLRLISDTGDVAWEGEIDQTSRTIGDTHQWSVAGVGLMRDAQRNRFRMVFVDRDMGQWGPVSLARQIVYTTAGNPSGKIQASAGSDGIVWDVPVEALPSGENSELSYTAPEGCLIASIAYRATRSGLFTNAEAPAVFLSATPLDYGGSQSLTFDDTLRTQPLSTSAKSIMLRVHMNNTATPAAPWQQRVTKFAAFGDHNLPGRTWDPNEPPGTYASDVIRWLIQNQCSVLNTGGVQDSNYPIGHLVFRESTTAFDAMRTVNAFHQWGLEVWEGGTVHFAPVDMSDYDWEIRLSEHGATLDDQGLSTADLANAIEVTFTDAADGQTKTLLPENYADLRDGTPGNLVTAAGKWQEAQISIQALATEADALQIGRAALAQMSQPRSPGGCSIRGTVKDRQGIPQPVWKVRAGDRALITDHPSEDPILIAATSYTHESLTNSLTFDGPPNRLEPFLERLVVAQEAEGLR